jgi:diguanylate cyclase (GGDEF)-like protein
MKLFLDRNRTLLPKIDTIYLITRSMVLISICYYIYANNLMKIDPIFTFAVIGSFVAHLVLFIIATRDKFDIKLAYLSAVIYDLILIPLLVLHTGGNSSSFYLLFFLTVSVAAYVLTFWFSLASTIIVTLGLLGAVYTDFFYGDTFNVFLKVGFIWVYYWAIMYVSDYMHKSENRLLKLLNTLNLRTSELEKSQAHLEMIYENTRVLASIFEPDSIVKEIMRLMSNYLNFDGCGVIFSDSNRKFYYRARYTIGETNFHPKALDMLSADFIKKVVLQQEPIIIKDVAKRDDYVPLNEKTRGLMIIPMVAHGRTKGVLIAESILTDRFKEKDIQIITAIARSGAIGLENAHLHRKTQELTIVDELTGSYNYRHFAKKLTEEKRRSRRYGSALSLIMVDIDWFKKLNDNYGHEAGNLVLKQLSETIKKCIRDVDIFARYGGEEFAVILPQTPLRDARVIGERIRQQVEARDFIIGENQTTNITVSIGLTSFPENGKSQEELVSVADQALYHAKGDGRNQVCVI